VAATGGATLWLQIPGDPRNNYLARMDWANNSSEVWVQQLNRLQNTNEFLIANAGTGAVRTVFVDQDSTWVETVDDLTWLDGGKRFLWTSERDGWNHAYSVSRDGSDVRLLTPGAYDVLGVSSVDTKGGWLYYTASPTIRRAPQYPLTAPATGVADACGRRRMRNMPPTPPTPSTTGRRSGGPGPPNRWRSLAPVGASPWRAPLKERVAARGPARRVLAVTSAAACRG
jgi:hypothetical protein